MVDASSDADFMDRALFLAERGRGTTSPNPAVGAVVVSQEGVVVGENSGAPKRRVCRFDDRGAPAASTSNVLSEHSRDHTGNE